MKNRKSQALGANEIFEAEVQSVSGNFSGRQAHMQHLSAASMAVTAAVRAQGLLKLTQRLQGSVDDGTKVHRSGQEQQRVRHLTYIIYIYHKK